MAPVTTDRAGAVTSDSAFDRARRCGDSAPRGDQVVARRLGRRRLVVTLREAATAVSELSERAVRLSGVAERIDERLRSLALTVTLFAAPPRPCIAFWTHTKALIERDAFGRVVEVLL